MQINDSNFPPGADLYAQVRGAFIQSHDSYTAWCRREGLNVSNVREAICGSWNGKKGKEIRHRAIKESGLAGKQHSTTTTAANGDKHTSLSPAVASN